MATNDPTRLTRSDLIPVLSSRGFLRNLPFSRTFWVLVALAGVEIYMFQASRTPFAQTRSLSVVIVFALLFLGIFLGGMIGFVRAKASLVHVAFGVVVATALWQTPLMGAWIHLWRVPSLDPAGLSQPAPRPQAQANAAVLPGQGQPQGQPQAPPTGQPQGQGQPQAAPQEQRQRPSVGAYFVSMFFGAGVAEDSFKIMPAALLLLIALLVRRAYGDNAPILRYVEPYRPTTILMVALASAATFVFFETVYQYVPDRIIRLADDVEDDVRRMLGCLPPQALQGRSPAEIERNVNCLRVAGDFALTLGYLDGMLLLMARVIGFISGHGAYAAIAAYGLVLAVNKTRGWSRVPFGIAMVVGAVIVSATLHGLWNTIVYTRGEDLWSGLVLCLVSLVILLAVASKARELDRQLGYTTTRQLGDSLVLAPMVPVFAGTPAAASTQAVAATPRRTAQAAVGGVATLIVDGTRIAIVPDATVDLAAHVQRAAGVKLEVVSRPGEASTFGLRNRGSHTWQVTTTGGRAAEVAPGRVAALSDGMAIDFGPVSGTVTTEAMA